MKRLAIIAAIGLFSVVSVMAQKAQKPKIMVVPSKQWCAQNGYGTRLDDGTFAPNLNTALEDQTFRDAVSGIENVFTDKEYPPVNLSESLDKLAEERAMVMVNQGKDGSAVMEDDIDILLRSVSPDVKIELEVTPVAKGAFNQVKYNIKVCDAASSKTWMSKADVSARTPQPVERLIQDAVNTFADEMIEKIQKQFDTMHEEGREITVVLNIGDSSDLNFESEVDFMGDTGELAELIEYWMNEHTVNNAFTTGTRTPNTLKFEQCRIPLTGKAKFGGSQKAISAADFAGDLRKFLEQNLNLTLSVRPKGIGTVYCVISPKN